MKRKLMIEEENRRRQEEARVHAMMQLRLEQQRIQEQQAYQAVERQQLMSMHQHNSMVSFA
jgi:hypothetical protein